jgi:hypothetical protein
MKVVDIKEGRLLGINFIDIFVVVVVAFLLFSFGSTILFKDLTFSGDEMYSAIKEFEKLNEKGFLVEAVAEGKWIGTEDVLFNSRGLIVRPTRGAFEFKLKDGRILKLGGSMSYLEDIALDKITLIPLDRHIAKLKTSPGYQFKSYNEMISYLKNLKEKNNADHLIITADFSFINSVETPQELYNKFRRRYLIRDVGKGISTENAVTLRLELAELSELENTHVKCDSIALGEVVIYLGYDTEEKPEQPTDSGPVISYEDLL